MNSTRRNVAVTHDCDRREQWKYLQRVLDMSQSLVRAVRFDRIDIEQQVCVCVLISLSTVCVQGCSRRSSYRR
jgi:hypothetical protein